ncbi:MAG: MFS transporter [Candidatus Omnitrophota bacterium]
MNNSVINDRTKQNLLIGIVGASIFMFTLDYSLLNISLPAVSNYFNVSVGIIARLPLAYLLVLTSCLLGFGKLGDIKGYANIFIIGLVIFLGGTVLCGIAPNVNALLAFRILQSAGEAMFSPTGIALVTTFLPSNMKGRALGVLATAQGLGFSLGPALGGFLNTHFSWRAIFFVNVPIAIIAIIFALKYLPKKQEKTVGASVDASFDMVGALLIFAALASLIFGLNSVVKKGWTDPVIIGSFAVFAICLPLFIIQEKRTAHPLLDLGLFANRDFTLANCAALFAICVYIGVTFLLPFYLQLIRGIGIARAGLLLMIPSIIMMTLAPFAGRISDSIGSRKLCLFGMIPATASFCIFALLHQTTNIMVIAAALVLLGLAMGSFMAPNNKLVMSHAPLDKQGTASGVYKIVVNVGSVFGIALFPLVLAQSILGRIAREHIDKAMVRHSPDILQGGFQKAFIFGIALCVAALLFSALAKDKAEN